jgi:hypothetical protein
MADINDRLERLVRRDELARRLLHHRIVPPEVAGVGGDFLDVVEAVADVVGRHPGMSIMLAPGDGRPGSAVVRVTETHGDAEVALITAPANRAQPTPRPRATPDDRDDRDRSVGSAGSAEPPADTAIPPATVPPAAAPARPAGPGRSEHPAAPGWLAPGRRPPGATGPEYGRGQPTGPRREG